MRHHCTIDNYFKTKNNQRKKRKPGPKAKLKPSEKSRIFREINKERKTISKIKSAVELNFSRETIRRVIQSSSNVIFTKFPRKPPLTKTIKLKRLQFAESHQGWNEEWQSIVWK